MPAVSLLCITRPALDATNSLLEAACESRGVVFVMLEAGRLAAGGFPQGTGPRLLYRAATDRASIYLEKLLHGPDVTAFADPHFPCDHPPIRLLRAGLPVPRKVFLPAGDPDGLKAQVDWLGGFPVVLKRPGTEGGRGVTRADGLEALQADLDAAPAGSTLEAFVPHGRAYRLLVVGGRALACTAAAPGPGDFRSNRPGARDLGPVEPPAGAAELACRAADALRLELGGVDLLEGDDGALYVAEVNCPCYFADQQAATGLDLAGAMVDHLLAKSRASARGR